VPPPFAPSAPGFGGPRCSKWLGYAPKATTSGNPGTVARATRGRCVWPDGDDTCSLAVGSVGGGDDVAATVFVAYGLEIM
jgi:hypothetical protein